MNGGGRQLYNECAGAAATQFYLSFYTDTRFREMKFQTLLTTLYYLLFSSSANQINDTITGTRETRAPKNTFIYHNGHPVQVLGLPQQHVQVLGHPQQTQQYAGLHTLASDSVPIKTEPGPKIALQRDKVVIHNGNSYLQDSYGNQYFSQPKQVTYKTTFPQQYVALQDLPAHFPQPSIEQTRATPAHASPQFSFQEFQKPAFHQANNVPVAFDFSKVTHSLPLVLPQQHLNIPIQSHYKVGNGNPLIASNNHPVTYSFHPSPSQRFVNFAPEKHHYHSVPNYPTNIQSSSNVLNHKVQFDQPKQNERHYQTQKQKQPNKKNFNKQPIRVSEELKTIDPQYFKPQVFSNPIVPQVQHYLPQIQNVLQYSILPRPEVKIAIPSEGRQQEERPIEKKINQIISRPESNHKIVINEYKSPEKHEHKEEVKAEVVDEEENEENNFQEGYQEAAKGFPAYSYNDDYEKKIYDADSYGEPHYHETISYNPLDESYSSEPEDQRSSKFVTTGSIQHHAYGDDQHPKEVKPIPYTPDKKKNTFPKDKNEKSNSKWSKQIEKPKLSRTSIKSEHHEQEIPYHFGNQRHLNEDNHKSPKAARYEIDYSKGYVQPSIESFRLNEYDGQRARGDQSSARFIEPQYQYGFEPILSRNDSEEQTPSASNVVHQSGVHPGTMKKVYKENWYISKTSSSEAEMDS